MNDEILLKFFTAVAVIVAALLAAVAGIYGQLKVKQYESNAQLDKEARSQRQKLYLPLLRFCKDLDRRLGHILIKLDTDWLRASHLEGIRKNEGFAVNPNEKGYFIISSIYMLACFFGWAEALKRSSDSTKPLVEKSLLGRIRIRVVRKFFPKWQRPEMQTVLLFDHDISTLSKLFQYEECFRDYLTSKRMQSPKDACKLHKHIQYSIGELMLEREGTDGFRCKSFREFLEAYTRDEKFRYWFVVLENLVADLSDFAGAKELETQVELKNDMRPLRLLAIRYWCRILMKNIAEELGVETPAPEEVFNGVSESLKSTIMSVKVEALETYLLGIRISD